ncbi:unnamed protein product [Cladocopium goreaui]|uniref:Glyceraldehyde-3-phosphate dehydrogenase n=1 Tax=Cladocopium goreaui TaxID=2562237 RepID=A0A9P1G2A8_9DINO|nr:unnamed protein product [Cladocopium goreaui]
MKKRSEGDMKGVLGAVPTDCDTCSDGSDDFKENSELEKETTYEEVCTEMKKRSEGDMKGVLGAVPTDCDTCSDGSDDFKVDLADDPHDISWVGKQFLNRHDLCAFYHWQLR